MAGGRKRKPDHLKIVSGTDQPCRMNPDAPEPTKGQPIAPAWLSERATEIFVQIAGIVDGLGIGSPDFAPMLALLASRIEEVEICTVMIEDFGRTYETMNATGGTMIRSRPEVAQRNEAMRHAQSLLAEFGLSPAAIGKVSAGGKRETNPFAALGG